MSLMDSVNSLLNTGNDVSMEKKLKAIKASADKERREYLQVLEQELQEHLQGLTQDWNENLRLLEQDWQEKLNSLQVTEQDRSFDEQKAQLLHQENREAWEKAREEYLEILAQYRDSLATYQEKLEALSATEEDQMAAVQVALDLTYIKEELDGIVGRQKEINENIGKLDSTIIEPIKKNYTANRNATVEKLDEVMNMIKEENKSLRTSLHLSLFFNVLCTGGLVFVILTMMGII